MILYFSKLVTEFSHVFPRNTQLHSREVQPQRQDYAPLILENGLDPGCGHLTKGTWLGGRAGRAKMADQKTSEDYVNGYFLSDKSTDMICDIDMILISDDSRVDISYHMEFI